MKHETDTTVKQRNMQTADGSLGLPTEGSIPRWRSSCRMLIHGLRVSGLGL